MQETLLTEEERQEGHADPRPRRISPQMSGQVQAQYVRCGKPSCHCAHGEPHGPYYYRIWREGMRVRKEYVRSEDVEAVRLACERHASLMRELRRVRAKRRAVVSQLRSQWRGTQSLIAASRKSA